MDKSQSSEGYAIAIRKSDNTLALSLMAIGLIILITGCGIAVYRNRQMGEDERIDRDVSLIIEGIISDQASNSGAVSMSGLRSDPPDPGNGRAIHVTLTTMEGDDLDLFMPDERTFHDMVDGRNSHLSRTVAVATEDGRVIPGRLEVTLVE